jgi:hypothetical protein
VRDILHTIPAGGSVDLEVEIGALNEGPCERTVVFYVSARHLVERPVLFRAVGKQAAEHAAAETIDCSLRRSHGRPVPSAE